MGHLTPEDLLDLAEGARSGDSSPHLASCETCRRELADLRTALSAAAEIEVPEPSPLFWGHLSERVRQAVEAEGRGRIGPRFVPWLTWRFVLPLGAAAVVLAIAASLRTGLSEPGAGVEEAALAPSLVEATSDPMSGDLAEETSIGLIADLAGEWDWEFAAEAGLTAPEGAVDVLVHELSDAERLELRRLLEDELTRGGA